ncbi:hypothetical protein GCK32_022623 [Trichostrongylus colubriformis]|uniref:Uncharacterized protein n=1 Tax=Trichostrongylus colubriformis TaxID=6319 RepID=A0AAN8FS62_TRICO
MPNTKGANRSDSLRSSSPSRYPTAKS